MSGARRRKRKVATMMEDLIRSTPTASSTSVRQELEPQDSPAVDEECCSSYLKANGGPCCANEDAKRKKMALPATSLSSLLPGQPSDNDDIDVVSNLNKCLGSVGYILLIKLLKFIPAAFKSRRQEYIRNILEVALSIHLDLKEVAHYVAMGESISMTKRAQIEQLLGPIPQDVLWRATLKHGTPHNMFLCPPVTTCLQCGASLQKHHEATTVICFTWDGPIPACKETLRCERCLINYRYEQFGNKSSGYRYYDDQREMVFGTQTAYMDRCCCSHFGAAGHHAWTSFEAMAEIYNEVQRVTQNSNATNMAKFLAMHPIREDYSINNTNDSELRGLNAAELNRKIVANIFWNAELEEELRDQGLGSYRFTCTADREKAMEEVDKLRARSIYEHRDCSDECLRRGCGKLFSIDGNWKLSYPICMYRVPKQISGFDGALKYVDSCPNQPAPGMAFCEHHCSVATTKGVPCPLREFLQHIGVNHDDTDDASPEDDRKIQHQMKKNLVDTSSHLAVAADVQGTTTVLTKFSNLEVLDDGGEVEATKTKCNKDTGEKKRLQKWTRGVWVCASGGGHIQMWQPLYQSEGPAQVFLLVLSWLVAAFGHKTRQTWKGITLSYDNMCHLDNLRVSKRPLPLPGDLKYIWQDIGKIIDTLHIRNHVDKECQVKYSPQDLKEKNEEYNTMVCEQTFAWLSRYKKILCSMPKIHHHFYLHRMIKRRNGYISYCYSHGRRPIQPSIKTKN